VDTFFWTDPWLGGITLCERFRRLFDIAENRSSLVAERSVGAACTSPCCFAVGRRVLHHVVLQTHSPNTWSWRPDRDHGYYVCGAYLLLTTQQQVTFGAVDDLIWHRQVPLKISIFAWRLLRDRLPTRQTWWLEASLPQTLTFGWPVEVTLNWLNIYCYLVALLVFFGI
jgi:hypothetical protein